jgi:hypothetical protein
MKRGNKCKDRKRNGCYELKVDLRRRQQDWQEMRGENWR